MVSDEMIDIFLDRDGVLMKSPHPFYSSNSRYSLDDVVLLDKAAEAVKILNSIGKVIVITNQSWVARGKITEEELNTVHKRMVKEFVRKGAWIDAIYYCPHHPETYHQDVPNWARKYRVDCNCRKPKTGLLDQAAKDFSLDLKNCFLIGDGTVDILAGKNAGCKTILVKTGEAGNDGKYDVNPDYICDDIFNAAKLISKIALKE